MWDNPHPHKKSHLENLWVKSWPHFHCSLKNHHHPPEALSLILITSKLNLDGPPLWPSCWVLSGPSGGRLVGRDPQHHTNPAPTVNQVRHQVPGREQNHGPSLQGTCSGRSQQWELPRLSPFCQHPGYASCGGTNPKSDGFAHTPAILPFTLQLSASLASLSSWKEPSWHLPNAQLSSPLFLPQAAFPDCQASSVSFRAIILQGSGLIVGYLLNGWLPTWF